MAQNMPPSVLAHEVAEICAESHVSNCGLFISPILDGEAFEEYEAFFIEELMADGEEVVGEAREWESVLVNY